MASGLDVDEIVQGLMQVERAPLDRLLQQKQILQWQQDDLRQINRALRELRDLAFSLHLEQTFHNRTVTSSDESIISARVGANVATGTHSITVHQLADGVRFHSGEDITTGSKTGTLAEQFGISDASISFTITNAGANDGAGVTKTFTFDTDTHTIRDIVAEINASDLELQAVYEADLDRFFLTSKQTGEAVQITFDQDDNLFLRDVLKLRASDDTAIKVDDPEGVYRGQDAVFDYNGAKNLKRSTNEFSIGGVQYTLHNADPGKTVTIQVSQDIDKTVETIKGFVEKYNEVIEQINRKLSEKRYYDFPPLNEAQKAEMKEKEIELWEEKARSGLLRGDSMLTNILSNMRLALGGTVSDTDSVYRTLSSIGITTGDWREQGMLHLDESKLREALASDASGVAALFRQDSTSSGALGLARRLTGSLDLGMELIGNRVGRADAAVDQSTIGRQIGWIDDAIERSQRRLEQREAQLYRQFSVLESFMSHMNMQSLWLAQTFMGGGF